MIIANHTINEVINYSTKSIKSLIDISVDYNSDLEKVEKVLNEVCDSLNKKITYLTSNIEIFGIHELADSAIIYRLVAECKPVQEKFLKKEIYKTVKIAFDENKINIPFPQVVIHNEK